LTKIPRLADSLLAGNDQFKYEWYANQLLPLIDNAENGTVAVADTAGGSLTVPTAATDNDASLVNTPEHFKFGDDKPFWGQFIGSYTEANTDDANVYVGFANAPDADLMVDDGAGPKVDMSGAGFFKVDGGTNWNIIVSVGTDQHKAELTAANALDGVAHAAGGAFNMQIEVVSVSATEIRVNFYLDGVHVYQRKHALGTPTEMAAVFKIKAGGANVETLNCKALLAAGVR